MLVSNFSTSLVTKYNSTKDYVMATDLTWNITTVDVYFLKIINDANESHITAFKIKSWIVKYFSNDKTSMTILNTKWWESFRQVKTAKHYVKA